MWLVRRWLLRWVEGDVLVNMQLHSATAVSCIHLKGADGMPPSSRVGGCVHTMVIQMVGLLKGLAFI
jgi:hypothetical protein